MDIRAVTAALFLAASLCGSEPDRAGLQPGGFPASWITGGPDCAAVPDWQIHPYNGTFYILRESGCIDAEKPFLYLIIGEQKALLEDTGAGKVNTADVVMALLDRWAKQKKHAPVSLVVIHSHGHGDHTAGDKAFQAMANVEFIPAAPAEAKTIDLGGRVVDVIPIPGHHTASLALYDRATGILLTGDSLYPGRLYLPESAIATYTESAKRLVDFAATHPIAHVLGTHIEQQRTAYLDYPAGTRFQPDEHRLELARAHLLELYEGFLAIQSKPGKLALPDFTIVPRRR